MSKKKAVVVADPTLLLNSEEWREEVKDSHVHETEPYIFCYFLGTNQEARGAVKKLKEATGYKIIMIRHMDEFVKQDEQFGDEAPYDVDPNDFVKYISEAAYICTDSFHCTAFCLQFHKRFMTFYRFAVGKKGGRNSRIDSLFNMLAVPREHIYQGDVMKIDNVIDWNVVDTKLAEIRQESISYLTKSLHDEE